MNRRDLLKSAALAALTAVVRPAIPPFSTRSRSAAAPAGVTLNRRMLRGTPNGKILESLDGGRTWQSIANLGAHCSVHQVFESQAQIYAQVRLQDYSFLLRSPNGRTWYTADPLAPVA